MPPSFFSQKVKTHMYKKWKIKCNLPEVCLIAHKEFADGIDMVEVANLFVGDNQQCKHLFGKFSKNDLPVKSMFAPMMILTRETFSGSKIQRQSAFSGLKINSTVWWPVGPVSLNS